MGVLGMEVKAVLFDLFETLISEYAGGSRKTDRSHRDYEQRIGISNDVFRKEWNARLEQRMTGHYTDYPSVMSDIMAAHQVELAAGRIAELYEERIQEKLAAFEAIDASVIRMLDRLKRSGLKLALVSNCTEEEVRGWDACSLAPYFDEVLFSYQVRLAKPDTRIYELACSRLGVSAEQAAFVGDGGSNELLGAMNAGLTPFHSVWFVAEPYRKKVAACKVVETTDQLLNELGMDT